MKKTVSDIIFECGIDEKRKRLEENQHIMLSLKKSMSDLTFFLPVARYAYLLDYDQYYRSKKDLTDEEMDKYLDGKVQMEALEGNVDVMLYKELLREYHEKERECREYFQTINIDFRKGLKEVSLPNIFVFVGNIPNSDFKLSRHIISGNVHEAYIETPNTVIYPQKDFSSRRKARHFYNTVSFKYLEQLSQDEDFDCKIKRLGRVDIR